MVIPDGITLNEPPILSVWINNPPLSDSLNVTLDQLVCDSLPVIDTYIEKDIADLLADCTTTEKQILRDIIAVTKETMRKHR